MLIWLLACTSWNPPEVPEHGELRPVLMEVLHQRPSGTLDAFAGTATAGMAERWGVTVETAGHLRAARLPSEIARGWGGLVPSCANCHAGDVPRHAEVPGHGGAMLDVIEGVRTRDAALRDRAFERLEGAVDLGPSRTRILDLVGQIRSSDDPGVHSRALRRMLDPCWRCHLAL